MKTAIVLGSTGLVGSHLVRILQDSTYYSSVVLLNRRPSRYSFAQSRIIERIIDFDAPDLDDVSGDHLFCAMGTTLNKAGSQDAQFRIDCEYPTAIATRLRNQGVSSMVLVSSVGAHTNASSFYLRTKAQLEENIIALRFESTAILRPSVLAGNRSEFRAGEQAANVLLKAFSPLMIGALSKYRSIDAHTVAQRMAQLAKQELPGIRFLEFDQMRDSDKPEPGRT